MGTTVSYRNLVLTPSVGMLFGSIKTSFSYNGEDWASGDEFSALMLDLSLGYRVKLFPHFAIVPQGGLGLIEISENPNNGAGELNFKPIVSLGLSFEYFTLETLSTRLAFGVAYSRLIDPWDDRFEGSELVLWLSSGYSFSF